MDPIGLRILFDNVHFLQLFLNRSYAMDLIKKWKSKEAAGIEQGTTVVVGPMESVTFAFAWKNVQAMHTFNAQQMIQQMQQQPQPGMGNSWQGQGRGSLGSGLN